MTKNLLKIKIPTDRLLLVPISLKYKEDIFREFTAEITYFMYPKPPEKIEETIDFIEESLVGLKDGSNLQLVVLAKESKEFLGCAGVHKLDSETPEFGIWIKKSAHGQGYGREAVTALKKWADKNIKYQYITYPVADENLSSRKIVESLGGKVAREYQEKNLSGREQHILEYRIYP